MCWWNSFKNHIASVDECRNLSALIFQQYNATAGTPLMSIEDDERTPIPHAINHDERCAFVAVIAAIVEEPPEEGFDACVELAEKIKEYKAPEEDIKDSSILARSIIHAVSNSAAKTIKNYTMSEDVGRHIIAFSAAVNAAIRAYNATGPEGLFTIKYLSDLFD